MGREERLWGAPIQTNMKKYYNDSNNNKYKKVYECLVFIENVFHITFTWLLLI